jgi:hypothetical protein
VRLAQVVDHYPYSSITQKESNFDPNVVAAQIKAGH